MWEEFELSEILAALNLFWYSSSVYVEICCVQAWSLTILNLLRLCIYQFLRIVEAWIRIQLELSMKFRIL
jgi:hypothetical protein